MNKHFLSICAVVKNEKAYIEEWLEFHRLQGVEHFYLYNNDEDQNQWKDAPDITGLWVPDWKPVQLRAYQSYLDTYGEESEWTAFIDCDEFLFSRCSLNVPGALRSFVPMYIDPIGAIAVHWQLYGSNYQLTKSEGLVIERFTKRQVDVNFHVKSIVKNSAVKSVGKNSHYFLLKKPYIAIDENGQLEEMYALCDKIGKENRILSIAHFHTKSYQEYKLRKGGGDSPDLSRYPIQNINTSYIAHDKNDVEDTFLRDNFAEKIKKCL